MAANSPAAAFFEALSERAEEPLLHRAEGTLRFDLTEDGHAEHWYVALHHGDVSVSRGNDPADAVVRVDKQTFEGMATGRVNATAAVLRGEIAVDGNLGLVLLFQRIFPAPGSGAAPAGGSDHA